MIAIDEYIEDAESYMNDIEKGVLEKNLEAISRNSHTLKSNSKSFGLMAVSKAAAEINVLCQNTLLDDAFFADVEQGLFDLRKCFSDGEVWLRSCLKKPFSI